MSRTSRVTTAVLLAAVTSAALAQQSSSALTGPSASATRTATAGGPAFPAGEGLPGERLPVVRARRYTMAGRIRPLLFWFGKDDVGLAHVVWRADGTGARGYQLLVGTDPAKAPRRLNRWGYIAEDVSERNATLLALMTRADETTYDEAEAGVSASASDFRAIRGRVEGGTARWVVTRLRSDTPFTIHEATAALAQARRDTSSGTAREAALAPAVRPGFLVAVAESIDATLAARATSPGGGPPPAGPVRYVFGQRTYELRVRDARRVPGRMGPHTVPAIAMGFEVLNLTTRERTRFEMVCGSDGELAGVPLTIQWQPRWWLKVELRLDAEGE